MLFTRITADWFWEYYQHRRNGGWPHLWDVSRDQFSDRLSDFDLWERFNKVRILNITRDARDVRMYLVDRTHKRKRHSRKGWDTIQWRSSSLNPLVQCKSYKDGSTNLRTNKIIFFFSDKVPPHFLFDKSLRRHQRLKELFPLLNAGIVTS